MRLIQLALIYLMIAAMIYLVASFGFWNLNPEKWDSGWRSLMAILYMGICLIVGIVAWDELD